MKKIVICVPLEEESIKRIEGITKTVLLKEPAEFHLVHSFEIQLYTYEFMAAYYPNEEQFKTIESSVKDILNKVSTSLSTKAAQGSTFKTVCLRSTDPKGQMTKYLNETKADMVVVATKGKHGIEGLFHSSFAEYMNRYAPCDVFILRPRS